MVWKGLITEYSIEPLMMDTLNKEHLSIKDTFYELVLVFFQDI